MTDGPGAVGVYNSRRRRFGGRAHRLSTTPPPSSAFHPTATPERIFGLDLLRALAIFSVLEGHALKVFYPHWPRIGVLGHGGFYGVELFFVLSGFLIGQILLKLGPAMEQPSTLLVFYIRRWLRTLPLYWLFIAVNVWLVFHLYGMHFGAKDVFEHAFFLRTFAENRIAFIPESFSLAVEEWFYLLLPAALCLGLKTRARFVTVFLTTVAVFYLFSTVARMISAGEPVYSWSNRERVIVVDRFDALMIGVFAAWVAQRFPTFWRRHAWTLAGAGAVLALAMYLTLFRPDAVWVTNAPENFFARTFRFNLVSLGFALLLPAASGWTLARENWASQAVRRIALWSYSIYLVHQPVIQLVDRHLFPHVKTSAVEAVACFATQLGGAILISAVFYRFYEAPLTRLRETAAPAAARLFRRRASAN